MRMDKSSLKLKVQDLFEQPNSREEILLQVPKSMTSGTARCFRMQKPSTFYRLLLWHLIAILFHLSLWFRISLDNVILGFFYLQSRRITAPSKLPAAKGSTMKSLMRTQRSVQIVFGPSYK